MSFSYLFEKSIPVSIDSLNSQLLIFNKSMSQRSAVDALLEMQGRQTRSGGSLRPGRPEGDESLAAFGGAAAFPVNRIASTIETDDKHAILWGLTQPPRVRSQNSDSILYLVDSASRISGTPFDFYVKCGAPISALTVEITRCQLPKLPNVTQFNNAFTIVSEVGTISAIIPIGFYNPVSLVNALKLAIDVAFNGLDTVTVTYHTTNKTISITSNNNAKWYFLSTSTFISRGNYLAGFTGLSTGVPGVVGMITQYSGILGMCYTRYVRIRSNIMTRFAKESSRSSANINNIVACISLANYYNPSDYDQSGAFSGAIITDFSTDSSSVNNLASKTQLNEIDFRIEDEYGTSLQDVLYLGAPYPQPVFNALMWLYIVV